MKSFSVHQPQIYELLKQCARKSWTEPEGQITNSRIRAEQLKRLLYDLFEKLVLIAENGWDQNEAGKALDESVTWLGELGDSIREELSQ